MIERMGAFALAGALILPFSIFIKWNYANINEALRMVPFYLFMCLCLCIVSGIIYVYERTFGLFCLYCIGNTIFYHTNSGIVQATQIVFGIGFLILLIEFFRNEFAKRAAVISLVILTVIQVFIATMQFLNIRFFTIGNNESPIIMGTLIHHNFLGAFLAFTGSLMPIQLLPLNLMGILMATSFLSYISLGGGLIAEIYNRIQTRRLIICSSCTFGIIIFGAFFFWNKSHDSFWSRLRIWNEAFKEIDSDWMILLFGKGLGSWYDRGLKDAVDPSQIYWQAHNEYLQLLYELGVVGLGFVIFWVLKNWRIFKNGPMVSIAISSFAIYVFHITVLAVPTLVIMALCIAKTRFERENRKCDDSQLAQQRSSAYYV